MAASWIAKGIALAKAPKVIRVSDATYEWLVEEAERLSDELGINVKLSDAANYHLKKLVDAADNARRAREALASYPTIAAVKP